jgi:hypothetical protein
MVVDKRHRNGLRTGKGARGGALRAIYVDDRFVGFAVTQVPTLGLMSFGRRT